MSKSTTFKIDIRSDHGRQVNINIRQFAFDLRNCKKKVEISENEIKKGYVIPIRTLMRRLKIDNMKKPGLGPQGILVYLNVI